MVLQPHQERWEIVDDAPKRHHAPSSSDQPIPRWRDARQRGTSPPPSSIPSFPPHAIVPALSFSTPTPATPSRPRATATANSLSFRCWHRHRPEPAGPKYRRCHRRSGRPVSHLARLPSSPTSGMRCSPFEVDRSSSARRSSHSSLFIAEGGRDRLASCCVLVASRPWSNRWPQHLQN